MTGLALIGAPSSLGAGISGAEAGPAELRRRGLAERIQSLGLGVADYGDVVELAYPPPQPSPAARLRAVAALARAVRETAGRAFEGGLLPVTLGGDHCAALGSIAASMRARPGVGLLWVDAHPDFNTPKTSLSGNPHGMVLAFACGLGPVPFLRSLGPVPLVPPERVAILGARAIDPGEQEVLDRARVRMDTVQSMRKRGLDRAVSDAIGHLKAQGCSVAHVSVDLDVLEPTRWPGVSTPAPGGLALDELTDLLRAISRRIEIVALDVVELNPLRDRDGQTAVAGVGVIESALAPRSRKALKPAS